MNAAQRSAPGAPVPRLQARGLSCSVRQRLATQPGTAQRRLLDDISLHVDDGELVGLIGPNGAGKTTLLGVLAGLVDCQAGTIDIDGRPLGRYSALERARTLGWMEQLSTIHWPLSVERLVALGRLPHMQPWQRVTASDQAVIEQTLQDTDCLHLRDQRVDTLSGGERTRVLLARALATQPSLLLADEPIAALDLAHQLHTMESLRRFSQGRRACIVVLHDLSLAARYCDRLYLLHEGRLAAEGSVAAVLNNDNIRRVYGVEVIAGCTEVPWIVPVRQVSGIDAEPEASECTHAHRSTPTPGTS